VLALQDVGWWLTSDSRLAAAYGPGWIGDGTRQIVVYRRDRVPLIRPYGQPTSIVK
jgi:hypothetical protein